jgi:hypothetical protein
VPNNRWDVEEGALEPRLGPRREFDDTKKQARALNGPKSARNAQCILLTGLTAGAGEGREAQCRRR